MSNLKGNSYTPCLLVIIAFCFTCGESEIWSQKVSKYYFHDYINNGRSNADSLLLICPLWQHGSKSKNYRVHHLSSNLRVPRDHSSLDVVFILRVRNNYLSTTCKKIPHIHTLGKFKFWRNTHVFGFLA